jgi:hypothetical protein
MHKSKCRNTSKSKSDKGMTKKDSKPIFLMNIDAKILNNILVKQSTCSSDRAGFIPVMQGWYDIHKSWEWIRVSILSMHIQCVRILSQSNKTKERNKRNKNRKGRSLITLFANTILHLRDPKDSSKKELLDLINTFRKVA